MSNLRASLLQDFTRGGQTTLHAMRMLGQVTKYLLALSIVFIVTFNIFWGFYKTSSYERYLLFRWLIASAHTEYGNENHSMHILEPNGDPVSITAQQIVGNNQINAIVNSLEVRLWDGVKISLAICGFFGFLMIISLSISGSQKRKHRFRRGVQAVNPSELRKAIRGHGQASQYSIAKLPLIKNSETKHILISGSTGTGKTVAMTELLDQIRAQGQRAIVYDKMGTFVRHYYRESKDILLNPLDSRCPSWDIWSEGVKPTDFDTLASALIPPNAPGTDRTWTDTARTLFSSVANKLYREGDTRMSRLLALLQHSDIDTLAQFVKGTAAEPLVNEEAAKFSLSILGSLTLSLKPLNLLCANEARPQFSIRDWVADESNDSWLFISSRANMHASLKPLISTWLEIATNSLLSLPADPERRIWSVIDELPSLQKLPSLSSALAESRQFGGCIMLSIQTIAQLRDIYGRDGAEALSGLCSTRLSFRTPDPSTADWVSNSLGKSEVDETKEGYSYGANEIRDGVSLHSQTMLRPVVLASEILALEDLSAYVRLPGNWPVCKVKFTPKSRNIVSEAFVPTDIKSLPSDVDAKRENSEPEIAAELCDGSPTRASTLNKKSSNELPI